MTTQVLLFTSPTCPHCPAAKRWAKENIAERDDIEYFDFPATDPEGQRMAKIFKVQSVPTFVVIGEGYDKPIGFSGTPSNEHFEKLLKLAEGKIQEEEI